jgi:type VI secretion system secreted protein Hcp
MALNAYLKLKGATQGDIKGSVTQKGREGKIMVIAVSHQIVSPRDAASGLATGKRQHLPFIITKELDKSSPLLFSALVNNENLTTFELLYFKPQLSGLGAGAETNNYKVELTNAQIVDIKHTQLNNKLPEYANLPVLEEVAFTYEKITCTWVTGGITANDDWN